MTRRILLLPVVATLLLAVDLPQQWTAGNIESVVTFSGPMPTGVAISKEGRIFVNFPRWGDAVDFTVAEVKAGKPLPYPEAAMNRQDQTNQADHFQSVQSVVIGPLFAPTTYGGPKLVGIDITTGKIFKKILFPQDVALPTTYLNDVRFDLRRGTEGMAFITDSSAKGPNGIIVVDLASGKSWRKLNDHPSTKPDPSFIPVVEARQVWQTDAAGKRTRWAMGADGIAIDPGNKILYYCPLSSRHLFSVSLDALANEGASDDEVAATVKDLGEKGSSATDYEHNAIQLRTPDGNWFTLAHDPRMLWPDTLSLIDGYLYFTCNQLHRQAQFNRAKDMRQKPYVLFRTRVEARKIMP